MNFGQTRAIRLQTRWVDDLKVWSFFGLLTLGHCSCGGRRGQTEASCLTLRISLGLTKADDSPRRKQDQGGFIHRVSVHSRVNERSTWVKRKEEKLASSQQKEANSCEHFPFEVKHSSARPSPLQRPSSHFPVVFVPS